MSLYEIEVTDIHGRRRTLAEYKGKVLLIVNTASRCGLTPQYEGLQRLYDAYAARGLVVLGFPCNQFMEQEPGSEADILSFCRTNYGVTFPLFAKIEVNGPNAHPLYRLLKQAAPGPNGGGEIEWNFTKFLVDRNGNVVRRFAPGDPPEAIRPHVERLLPPSSNGMIENGMNEPEDGSAV
jgi:glutathione peroxidase